jgi:hypothetical protein
MVIGWRTVEMDDDRLPAHLEVSGLLRSVQAAGGFATVLAKGERHAGTILVVCCQRGTHARAYERMPTPEGHRKWALAKAEDPENPMEFTAFCDRRRAQDSDLWIVELDCENAEKFLDPDLKVN